MTIEKHCLIIFDEKEAIPLLVEIEDKENKKYIPYPLSIDKIDLITFISDAQQIQLQKKIETMKIYIQMIDQMNHKELRPKNLTSYHYNLVKHHSIKQKNHNLENIWPDFFFGPKLLQSNVGQYDFEMANRQIRNQSSLSQSIIDQRGILNPGANVAILIYQGENFYDLKAQINYYGENRIKPIILINGKSAFKKLTRSMNTLSDYYSQIYLPFHSKFKTSNHHSIYFQIQGLIAYFFAFAEEFNKLDLIKWIYLGLLKLIQPKYVVIESSNEAFDININILQLFKILEDEPNYFGVQYIKRNNFSSIFLNAYQGDFSDVAITIDSMFKIKQFHNPLSCIYEWSKIDHLIDNYIRKLNSEYFTNTWALGYSSILPKLMMEQSGYELKIITKQITLQKVSVNQFERTYNQFFEYKQNINNQLRKCGFYQFKNVFQFLISEIQFLYNYFGFSICLFFSFQFPYQLIYNLFEDSVGYTALAIILPILYSINVILFLLLSSLYHFNDKIIEKEQVHEVSMMATRNQHYEYDFQTSVNSENIDILFNSEQMKQEEINFQVQEDEFIKNYSFKMKNEHLQKHELFFKYKFPQLKNISVKMGYLIDAQTYLDIAVVLSVCVNIIYIHGKVLETEQSDFEIGLFIFVFIVLFYLLITKRLGIFSFVIKFSLITYFWQFLQLPKSATSTTQRINEKRTLGSQLFLNFILFYTFIAVESYYNYSGYVLFGVLAYLTITYLSIGFFQFVQFLFYNPIIPVQGSDYWEGKVIVDFRQNIHRFQYGDDRFLAQLITKRKEIQQKRITKLIMKKINKQFVKEVVKQVIRQTLIGQQQQQNTVQHYSILQSKRMDDKVQSINGKQLIQSQFNQQSNFKQ